MAMWHEIDYRDTMRLWDGGFRKASLYGPPPETAEGIRINNGRRPEDADRWPRDTRYAHGASDLARCQEMSDYKGGDAMYVVAWKNGKAVAYAIRMPDQSDWRVLANHDSIESLMAALTSAGGTEFNL